MCFETTKSARAKIAKTDIECWKRGRNDLSGVFKTSVFGHAYKVGKRNPIVKIRKERNIEEGETSWVIGAGYHSYKSDNDSLAWMGYLFKKFIIPAGTRYYENETEYVSETIKML